MGKIQKEIPVKLICGFISSKEELFRKAARSLSARFGEIDFESETLIFDYTKYYEEEMGQDLKRKFISFQRLISPAKLHLVKIFTNKLEVKFSKDIRRKINIDPGYIDGSKLILATTKDYSHRIYISKGIFAEVTLSFQKGGFVSLPWTYPDYKTEAYRQIFERIRTIYSNQIKSK